MRWGIFVLSQEIESKNLNRNLNSHDGDYEVAKLYRDRGDFINAIKILKPLSEKYHQEQEFEKYLKCLNDLMRIYAEQENHDGIKQVKDKIKKLIKSHDFKVTPYTYYTQGICAAYDGHFEEALNLFRKSLVISLENENKKDMCLAITGLAITYSQLERYQEALQEIYNLQVFFEVLPLSELKISSQILNGIILRKMGRYDQALETLWNCYEHLKQEKSHFLYLQALYAIGVTYKEQGDVELAKIYLQLLKRSLDPASFVKLSKDTDQRLKEIGCNHDEYDLIFDLAKNSVVEKKQGRIDFNNQFILLELLHLLMKHPGQTFSKETIVKKIWNQEYSPSTHDNKIYVTIKRLRKLIEPDIDKPKYIFRAKNGYYFNKASRVCFENKAGRL